MAIREIPNGHFDFKNRRRKKNRLSPNFAPGLHELFIGLPTANKRVVTFLSKG
jgi:hypothetical protein